MQQELELIIRLLCCGTCLVDTVCLSEFVRCFNHIWANRFEVSRLKLLKYRVTASCEGLSNTEEDLDDISRCGRGSRVSAVLWILLVR